MSQTRSVGKHHISPWVAKAARAPLRPTTASTPAWHRNAAGSPRLECDQLRANCMTTRPVANRRAGSSQPRANEPQGCRGCGTSNVDGSISPMFGAAQPGVRASVGHLARREVERVKDVGTGVAQAAALLRLRAEVRSPGGSQVQSRNRFRLPRDICGALAHPRRCRLVVQPEAAVVQSPGRGSGRVAFDLPFCATNPPPDRPPAGQPKPATRTRSPATGMHVAQSVHPW
jgi:hypothetical protein